MAAIGTGPGDRTLSLRRPCPRRHVPPPGHAATTPRGHWRRRCRSPVRRRWRRLCAVGAGAAAGAARCESPHDVPPLTQGNFSTNPPAHEDEAGGRRVAAMAGPEGDRDTGRRRQLASQPEKVKPMVGSGKLGGHNDSPPAPLTRWPAPSIHERASRDATAGAAAAPVGRVVRRNPVKACRIFVSAAAVAFWIFE
jgi:hypothetical protein